jgi:hypothetical protein
VAKKSEGVKTKAERPAKKPPTGQGATREHVRIVWLDAADQKIFESLPEKLWAQHKATAFAQCLRFAHKILMIDPGQATPFVYDSGQAWRDGTANCMRWNDREWQAIHDVAAKLDMSVSEAVRVVIRMGAERL